MALNIKIYTNLILTKKQHMKKEFKFTGKSNQVFKSLVLTLFIFISYATFAQVNIRGKVVDSAGESLVGVNVISRPLKSI